MIVGERVTVENKGLVFLKKTTLKKQWFQGHSFSQTSHFFGGFYIYLRKQVKWVIFTFFWGVKRRQQTNMYLYIYINIYIYMKISWDQHEITFDQLILRSSFSCTCQCQINILEDTLKVPKVYIYTLQEINISHLGKRKIIFKRDFLWDMLVPRRVTINDERFKCNLYCSGKKQQCPGHLFFLGEGRVPDSETYPYYMYFWI